MHSIAWQLLENITSIAGEVLFASLVFVTLLRYYCFCYHSNIAGKQPYLRKFQDGSAMVSGSCY